MKNIFGNISIVALILIACNSNTKSTESQAAATDTNTVSHVTATVTDSGNVTSIKDIVDSYLQLKNAFTKDNTNDAAAVATSLQSALQHFNKSTLTANQKKTFDDIQADATEHAEHIGKNGGNIAHQREHFEMLSKDIYDLAKAFGAGQTLYKDFCPMYNNGKGAFWLSEIKDIKNPYMGKKMATCGIVKEEIK